MSTVFLTPYQGSFIGPVANVLGWIMKWLYNFLGNFGIENAGIAIILFTFLIYLLLFPITYKQQKFTKMSMIMNPELTEINNKYKGKKDEESMRKMQLETQAVYEKYGANPASGCLPMFITMFMFLGLYRVVSNIPAYVPAIKEFYENVANAVQGIDGYLPLIQEYAEKFPILNTAKWEDLNTGLTTNHMVDLLAQFKATDWETLINEPLFSSVAETIRTNHDKIMDVNTLAFGLNIVETPFAQMKSGASIETKILYVLVPVVSMVTQIVSMKIGMRATQNNNNKSEDPTANMMKSMNTFMPIFFGIMTFSFPIGVAIYYITGNIFRILQQILIDWHFDRIGMDAILKKNQEKAAKKKEKRGIDPNAKLEEIAKKRTSSIQDKANVNMKNVKGIDKSENGKMETQSASSTYKEGSIAGYAHMVSRNQKGKEEK